MDGGDRLRGIVELEGASEGKGQAEWERESGGGHMEAWHSSSLKQARPPRLCEASWVIWHMDLAYACQSLGLREGQA